MVEQLVAGALPAGSDSSKDPSASTSTPSPAFDPAQVTVIHVLGGPEAGKSTQCARLVYEKDLVYLSAEKLLKEEKYGKTEVGQMMEECAKKGTALPAEVIVGLFQKEMQKVSRRTGLEHPAHFANIDARLTSAWTRTRRRASSSMTSRAS